MNKNILKELGISLLIVVAILLLITIIFYNKIAIGQVIPKVEHYALSEEIANEIENDILDETTEIVTTYKLDASDLKRYEKTNEYNKGKKNPFSVEITDTTTEEEDKDSTDKNNSTSENFYKDEGIK